jgi:hypothetical protein
MMFFTDILGYFETMRNKPTADKALKQYQPKDWYSKVANY